MKLPNYERATVPEAKITKYLLSPTHRDGRPKAPFFTRFGFSPAAWETLARTLIRHAAENEVTEVEGAPYGTRYVIEGMIHAPDGRTPAIRLVWFIETGEQDPRFVTSYPLRRRDRWSRN